MILGLDISHWQTNIDLDALYDGGVRFVIVKLSQGLYRDDLGAAHVAALHKDGRFIVGGYHWNDPTINDTQQANVFITAAKEYGIDFAAVDMEQFWASWDEWAKHDVKNVVSPSRISSSAQNVTKLIAAQLETPTLIYTRTSFINERARDALKWLPDCPLWIAWYPYAWPGTTLSWDKLHAEYEPKIAGKKPVLPTGSNNLRIWQWTGDALSLPGTSGPADLCYYPGTLDDMRAYFGVGAPVPTPTPKPSPEDDMPLPNFAMKNINSQNVRDNPGATGTTVLRTLSAGTNLGKPERAAWAGMDLWLYFPQVNGWMACYYNGKLYLRASK